jgi:hypothetical protein
MKRLLGLGIMLAVSVDSLAEPARRGPRTGEVYQCAVVTNAFTTFEKGRFVQQKTTEEKFPVQIRVLKDKLETTSTSPRTGEISTDSALIVSRSATGIYAATVAPLGAVNTTTLVIDGAGTPVYGQSVAYLLPDGVFVQEVTLWSCRRLR